MISILIPVYNTASYLADCFNSGINQSYQDFEVIVIDDGSTDESAQICDEWAKKCAHIKVFHQENQGLIAARREGWKHAVGEWMMFLDSDDMLPKDSLKTLHAAAEHTDMVIGACGGGGCAAPVNSLHAFRQQSITGGNWPISVWGKLYRKSLFEDAVFDVPRECYKGEDMLLNIKVAFRINRLPHFVNADVYTYRLRQDSITHTSSASLDYEALFDKYRIASIPKPFLSEYMNDILLSRLNGLNEVAVSDTYSLTMKHPFVKRICDDAEQAGFRLPWVYVVLLRTNIFWLKRSIGFYFRLRNFMRFRWRRLCQRFISKQ